MRLKGLGQLKKSNDLIGNRTRDLPACSIVPQPTTLLRAPALSLYLINYILRRDDAWGSECMDPSSLKVDTTWIHAVLKSALHGSM
jgi:hypothetical protein